MGYIFDFLGSLFGYLLWFFFDLVGNYGLAITLFTVFINLIMLPIAIKRQKSMTSTSKLASKQKELHKKYANNPKKYNEELAKLYESEGINPMSGCFSTMVVPLILFNGMLGAITRPLQNTLHISTEKVIVATETLKNIPEINNTFRPGYEQLQIVKLFSEIKQHLTMFNSDEINDIEKFSTGFNLCGLNLLDRPNVAGFYSMLWIIPLLYFIISVISMYIMQKLMGTQSDLKGCTKYSQYAIPLLIAYASYTVPAAVGVYWIVNAIFGIIQNMILNKFYNIYTINAKSEYQEFQKLKEIEKNIIQIKNPEDVQLNISKSKNSKKKK